MLCRIFIDHNAKDPALEGGSRLMMADTPVYGGKKTDYYYWYYGSLALNQYDGPDSPKKSGKFWGPWNKAMVDAVVALITPENVPSLAVAAKLGLEQCGVVEHHDRQHLLLKLTRPM